MKPLYLWYHDLNPRPIKTQRTADLKTKHNSDRQSQQIKKRDSTQIGKITTLAKTPLLKLKQT